MMKYIVQFIIIILVAFPFYMVIRRPWKYESKRELALGAFILFMVGLLVLALQGNYNMPLVMLQSGMERISSKEAINLTPFRMIKNFFLYSSLDTILINIVGNVVMFMPWGFGLVLLWKKNQTIGRIIRHSLLLTIFIETCQLFIWRNVDVDDLILNFIGGCTGAIFYFILRKCVPSISNLAK